MDLTRLTLSEIQAGFRAKSFRPADILRAFEARIQMVEPTVQAFLSRDFEAALRRAEDADVSLPLGGIPIGIKDVINVKGRSVHLCFENLARATSLPTTRRVVARLRTAGAIPFGRLNMDEFAMGSSTENSAYQITRNPWDTSRIPGGSSGGSAAAVAACEVPAALGSDTGGSIRQPAALCGCVGLKTELRARFSLRARRLCFLTRSDRNLRSLNARLRPAAQCHRWIGSDGLNLLDQSKEDFTGQLGRDLKGVRMGIPKEYFVEGMDVRVEGDDRGGHPTVVRNTVLNWSKSRCRIPNTQFRSITSSPPPKLRPISHVLTGFAMAYRAKPAERPDRPLWFGRAKTASATRSNGALFLARMFFPVATTMRYYLRAQKVRTLIRRDFSAAFEKVDVIVCPTSPDLALFHRRAD